MKTIGEHMGAVRKIKVNVEDTPYNASRRDRLMKLSNQRRMQKYKDRQARSYRKLFTRLTGEDYTGFHDEFLILEQQFGLRLIQETVEYMALKGQDWEVNSFMAYLLKVLQNKRDDLEATVDGTTERQREEGRRLLHEAKTWQVLKGILL